MEQAQGLTSKRQFKKGSLSWSEDYYIWVLIYYFTDDMFCGHDSRR